MPVVSTETHLLAAARRLFRVQSRAAHVCAQARVGRVCARTVYDCECGDVVLRSGHDYV